MESYDEFYYENVILLLYFMFEGDDSAKRIFEMSDWRAGINARAKKILKKPKVTGNRTNDQINADYSNPIEFITVGKRGAKRTLKDLKGWLRGSAQITICDPYLLKGPSAKLYSSEDEYVQYIKDLIPESAKHLKIFGNGFKTTVKNKMKKALKDGRKVEFFDTELIHDRYIIKDGQDGKLIGTSFGGLGNKIFTFLDLPVEDVKTLNSFLRKIEKQEALEDQT